MAKGWNASTGHSRMRSFSESDVPWNATGQLKNSDNYKEKKNPLGEDGKLLRCFKYALEYHLLNKFDKKLEEKS